jgi:hypothetical protein
MSNKNAALRWSLSYPGAGGATDTVPTVTTNCPFLAQNAGTIDIASGTTTATPFDIPFGAVGDGATLLLVFNNTAQPLILKVNATALIQNIGAGKWAVIAPGDIIGDTPITAATVTTTDAIAVDSSVDFLVFGDPGA